MTDNEIIKSFECCDKGLCGDCSYQSKIMCATELKRDALDLINRQQAEIERLELLIDSLNLVVDGLNKECETAKSEAIKDFAKRFIEYIDVGHLRTPTEKCFSELDVKDMIDNLVKEEGKEK